MLYNTMMYKTIQYNDGQYNAVQYDTIRRKTPQRITSYNTKVTCRVSVRVTYLDSTHTKDSNTKYKKMVNARKRESKFKIIIAL